MKLGLRVGLLFVLLVAGPSGVWGQTSPTLPAEVTLAQWSEWPESLKLLWVAGAQSAFGALGVKCVAPPTGGTMVDTMDHRYVLGTWQGTSRAIEGVLLVLVDHGCTFESEQIGGALNALLKKARMR